jgi:hypothetical protein
MFRKFSLSLLVAAVFLLHQDFWNWGQAEPFVFGFLPLGLAYHAAYAVLAAILMALLVKFFWPADLDRLESELGDHQQPPRP